MNVISCFQCMPLEAVNKLVFSSSSLTVDHFLDEEGNHSLLSCTYVGEVQPELVETQAQLMQEIANERNRNGKFTCLNNFLQRNSSVINKKILVDLDFYWLI